jgi:hypothetical protein
MCRSNVKLFEKDVQFEPPALQRLLPADLRSATFRVTYLDENMRITRGDRGELRVYAKDHHSLRRKDELELEEDVPDPEQNTTFQSSDERP